MSDWDKAMAERIGAAVKARRSELGWTAARLSDETERLHHPVHRVAIGKLENGHRGAKFEVAELVVLAKALGVPPMLLLYPDMPGGDVEVLPRVHTNSFAAARWFSGEDTLAWYLPTPESHPDLDRRAGAYYDGATLQEWHDGAKPLILARDEEALWERLRHNENRERQLVDSLRANPDDKTTQELIGFVQKSIQETKDEIGKVRVRQREGGSATIALSPRYSDIDERGAGHGEA